MSLWHQHRWRTVAERHQPGAHDLETQGGTMRGPGALEAYRIQAELTERIAYGITTVTQRCAECGKQTSYVVTGDARTESQP